MGKIFVVDVAKCSGCYSCQTACKDEHAGNDWTPYAKPQPDIGHFWIKLVETVQGSIPKVKVHYTAQMCNHCRNPKCLPACPAGAITQREDGFVLIHPEKCTGCGACASACPYGAIYKNEDLNIFQKCTGCAHLLDNGYKVPRCVENCPTDAIRFGDEEELKDEIPGAEVRQPETGCLPRVYYRNIPGKFIGGLVYDPVEKEVLIGARCVAVTGGKIIETFTDDFGDFWLKDLAIGTYDLTISFPGFKEFHKFGIRTDASVNLGEIPLERDDRDKDMDMRIHTEIHNIGSAGTF